MTTRKRGSARSKGPGAGPMGRHAKFAILLDGKWGPCDEEMNLWINRALHDWAGLPDSITIRDEDGEAHTLSGDARQVLYLALWAMDARLRPERGYREKADLCYTALAAAFHGKGIQELRRLFQLGAKRPWLEK
jgi:hypothetical protein